MIELEEIKRQNRIRKLVSNARAIISNEIGLPLGSLKMERIINWIEEIQPLEIKLKSFKNLNNQTNFYPLGTDRLNYNKDYLKTLDVELNKIINSFISDIIEECWIIIETFGK